MRRKLQLLILGIDGADPELVGGFMSQGELPHLAALARGGALVPLASTEPPTTYPAWTSFATGTPPSFHGVPDFTVRSGYRVRFTGAGDRAVPTLFAHLESLGFRAGAAWFPATYPPERLSGFSISGWDSPVTSVGDDTFVEPRRLGTEMRGRFGDAHVAFDAFDEFAGDPIRDLELRVRSLCLATERRAAIAQWLLETRDVDVAAFYFGAADTAAHHFWGFCDPRSLRRPHEVPKGAESSILRVYRAIDDAVGALIAAAPGASVILLSDHGSRGASDLVVHLNRALAEAGLLTPTAHKFPPPSAARSAAVAALPRALRRKLFRFASGLAPSLVESSLRFGGIDFTKTRAFSEELPYAPSVWLNQLGREPSGVVPYRDREKTAADVASALGKLATRDGRPLVARVIPREDLHRGPYRHRFPDLTVVMEEIDGYTPLCLPSRGAGPAVRRLAGDEILGRKGRSLPGCHGPFGVLAARRSDGNNPELHNPRIEDVAGLVCDLLGAPRAPWFGGETAADRATPGARPKTSRGSFHPSEERVIAARLRNLGYLE